MAGLYIHIPFCKSRCIYCGFYSTTLLPLRGQYVEALCREMELRPWHPRLSTIYLGGGTPSQLTHDELLRLFDNINKVYDVEPDAEITMEANPDDINEGLLDGLPVNRVSLGAQTFSDERLRFLRRRHDAKEVDQAVETLRHDGITNISIDLMFGFPCETMSDWQADIDHALRLRPEHLSAYGLMFEDGTPLKHMLEDGMVEEIDEEMSLSMYRTLIERLSAAGYEHYEISNFARRDGHAVSPYRSRHNSSYWHDVPYLGLGAGAHSYDRQKRWWNVADIRQYISAINQGQLPAEEEIIDADTHYDDLIVTALRTREGLDLNMLDDRHRAFLLENAADYIRRGLLIMEDNHLRLSLDGICISNQIMSDLMEV